MSYRGLTGFFAVLLDYLLYPDVEGGGEGELRY
jgi:hypothetical protein